MCPNCERMLSDLQNARERAISAMKERNDIMDSMLTLKQETTVWADKAGHYIAEASRHLDTIIALETKVSDLSCSRVAWTAVAAAEAALIVTALAAWFLF